MIGLTRKIERVKQLDGIETWNADVADGQGASRRGLAGAIAWMGRLNRMCANVRIFT